MLTQLQHPFFPVLHRHSVLEPSYKGYQMHITFGRGLMATGKGWRSVSERWYFYLLIQIFRTTPPLQEPAWSSLQNSIEHHTQVHEKQQGCTPPVAFLAQMISQGNQDYFHPKPRTASRLKWVQIMHLLLNHLKLCSLCPLPPFLVAQTKCPCRPGFYFQHWPARCLSKVRKRWMQQLSPLVCHGSWYSKAFCL